jgi:hypothetical protein
MFLAENSLPTINSQAIRLKFAGQLPMVNAQAHIALSFAANATIRQVLSQLTWLQSANFHQM